MPLSPDQWSRVTAAFDEILNATPDARAALLRALRRDDAAVCAEVESLLAADSDDGFLTPISGHRFEPGPSAAARLLGRTVGAYRIEREIGRGGMGVVYEGHHIDSTLQKRVAIKTLAIGLDRPELAWRFRRERQILARLEHPNIAALYDGGTTEDGIPYLVMEYVAGQRLDVWCDTQRLTIAQRIDLFRQVCAAVQFAHGNLIVHRDLKPGNILVTPDGVVKLLDFGVAKLAAVDDDITADDEKTRAGSVPLTTAYASPEQLRGGEVTTASDIYALGVILYRLLTGVSPHGGDGATRSATVSASARAPSDTAVATQPALLQLSGISAMRKALQGELDAIVLQAMRHEPERRYPSADALSADLLRYLKGLPVQARGDSIGYRLSSFVRRQRALVAGSTIAVVALVVGAGLAVASARTARAEAARARSMVGFLKGVVGGGDASIYSEQAVSPTISFREILDSTSLRIPAAFPDDPQARGDLYTALARSLRRFNRYDAALALLDSAQHLHRRSVGDVSLEVAEDMTIAALIQSQLGRFRETQRLLEGALRRYDQLPDAPPEASTIARFAWGQFLMEDLGRVEEGLALLTDATRRETGAASPRVALLGTIEGTRAVGFAALGRADESDSAFARAVQMQSADSARDGEELATTLINWGTMLNNRGRTDEAIPRIRRGVALTKWMSGGQHLSTAIATSRLGVALNAAGRFGEAMVATDSALSVHESLRIPSASEFTYLLHVRATSALGLANPQMAAHALTRSRPMLRQLDIDRSEREFSQLLLESRLAQATQDLRAARVIADSALRLARTAPDAETDWQRRAQKRLAQLDSVSSLRK